MQLVARAVRGPSWLAWLSLLFATQIGAADAIAGPEPDDVQDRAAVHAPVCPRPLPPLPGTSLEAGTANQDELPANPAVVAFPLARALPAGNRAVAELVQPVRPCAAFVQISPRAPPLSRSL
jgi:hypothetical protein